LKVWAVSGLETFLEEEDIEPEAPHPLHSKEGKEIMPEPVGFESDQITMSSRYNNANN
jgi:hypothetical protein